MAANDLNWICDRREVDRLVPPNQEEHILANPIDLGLARRNSEWSQRFANLLVAKLQDRRECPHFKPFVRIWKRRSLRPSLYQYEHILREQGSRSINVLWRKLYLLQM